MKILYIGGQKSGKTALAIKKTLLLANKQKPFYIACYRNNFDDIEMHKKINIHQKERGENFITIEEGFDLIKATKRDGVYLIDCLSMWIFNNLDKEIKWFEEHLNEFLKSNNSMVFILNEVSRGVIPIDNRSRKFVDFSGTVGQIIASKCDSVFNVICGIEVKIK